MHYSLISSLTQISTSCIVFGVFSEDNLNNFKDIKDEEQRRILPYLFKRVEEQGQWAWQSETNGASIMLIHCGEKKKFNTDALSKILQEVTETLLKHRIEKATLCLPGVNDRTPDEQLIQMILDIDALSYQFDNYKTHKKIHHLKTIECYLEGASKEALNIGMNITKGIELTQHLAELPANYCTPIYLANQAMHLAKEHAKIKTKLIEKHQLKEMGMGAILAVGQGSIEPPCLIELNYQGGNPDSPPIVLIGKGITFDAGGISIKPAASMDEMKYDMAGAASVLGTLKACALLNLPINVVGLIAAAENLPSGSAVKPGDVIKSYAGLSIEIMNTDAEGRLVLADALTYAKRFNPRHVIDIATLTGAMVVALGYIRTGFMTKDDALAALIMSASEASRDKAWRLPLDDAYGEAMESTIADLVNSSADRAAGAITAAAFLSKFADGFSWAHLDIAGTAWISGKKRRPTGRPVPLLIQLLRHAAA